MMTETPTPPRPSPARTIFASRGWRFAMMILLTLMMGIPLLMVVGLIGERAQYQRHAVGEVSNRWGGPVRLAGPVLAFVAVALAMLMTRGEDWSGGSPVRTPA